MTDRIKEAVFSSLGELEDVVVLDLYAGSGSLGLEALSRGARSATFVENARDAILKIEQNVEICDFADRSDVQSMEVQSMLSRSATERHDLIFVDPPYSLSVDAVQRDLESLVMGGFLADEGRIVVHRMSKDFNLAALGLRVIWQRTFGQSTVLVYTHEDEGE
jgi:16S rRNA (guanine966-N2)-methyltransferase